MDIQLWIVWLAIVLVALIIEVFTLGFAVSCFSVGAAVAAVAAMVGLSVTWQLILFSIFSIAALVTLRPLVMRYMAKRREDGAVLTNVDALIGRRAVVSVEIRNGLGRATIDGDDWKVEMEDRGEVIAVGDRVEIVRIESVVLIVKKL